MSTFMANAATVERTWYVVDASPWAVSLPTLPPF